MIQVKKEAMISSSNLQLRELKAEISALFDRESQIWSQRSRVQWLSNGDQNTRYFHSRATKKHRENLIVGIRDASQSWLDNLEKIAPVLLKHYEELFSSTTSISSSAILDRIPWVITNDMNSTLLAKFLEWGVIQALQQIAPLKALGPDGMPPLSALLEYSWSWCFPIGFVLAEYMYSPYPVNHTFITLISQVSNLEHVQECRLISLCNVLYKIFSKVLANRLKKILTTIIIEHSAFTKDLPISE